MDGLDLSALDESIFNQSFSESENEDDTMPQPDCIGFDSAIQDDAEQRNKQSTDRQAQRCLRDTEDQELEFRALNPNSLRRVILEKSLNEGASKPGGSLANCKTVPERDKPHNGRSHVMNIVEKAGMTGIDKDKINDIIHRASEGSLFYKKQAQRQEEIHRSIEKMLNKVKSATPTQVRNAQIQCDKLLQDLESQRVFNRVIIHIDLDMFFAAVEIRDNPSLADKPVAVGGDSMVSTSNYIARRFGVRAAMPGFIARKLCPDLIFIKPNGLKYRQASSQIFAILERYDQELVGMSLDEAYLDLTDYIKNTLERDNLDHEEYYDGKLPKIWWTRATEVVSEIRAAVFAETKLTCSAGIASNTLLAKIATDIKKPDGQFMIEGYPERIAEFIKDTLVGKVSGIGKVSGQFLNALEIKTCGDLYEKRHFLPLVFYEINVKFYLKVALGDGSTCIKSDEHRKSKSVERTFTAVKDPLILLDKLDNICNELCDKYLRPYRIRGRTITVKLKRNTFTTTTKSYSLLVPTNDKLVIYPTAKNLLLSEIANEPPEISYRLLGVRLSNLADDNVTAHQPTIEALLKHQEMSSSTKRETDTAESCMITEESSSNSSLCDRFSITSDKPDLRCLNDISIQENQEPKLVVPTETLKRKSPGPKTIGEYFSQNPRKQLKCEVSAASSSTLSGGGHQDSSELPGTSTTGQFEKLALVQPSDQQIPEIGESYDCPHCFKPFPSFESVESHVGVCKMKDTMDAYKLLSQRPVGNSQQQQQASSSSSSASTQAFKSQARAKSKKSKTPRKSLCSKVKDQ